MLWGIQGEERDIRGVMLALFLFVVGFAVTAYFSGEMTDVLISKEQALGAGDFHTLINLF